MLYFEILKYLKVGKGEAQHDESMQSLHFLPSTNANRKLCVIAQPQDSSLKVTFVERIRETSSKAITTSFLWCFSINGDLATP